VNPSSLGGRLNQSIESQVVEAFGKKFTWRISKYDPTTGQAAKQRKGAAWIKLTVRALKLQSRQATYADIDQKVVILIAEEQIG